MIGNNKLELCEAELMVALQEYLDKRMCTWAPKVAGVSHEVANVPVTVCIAMSEGGTFLSAFADTHWIQEDRKYQDLLKRAREDKQLWSVKYIRTSIQYPITTEKKE